MLTRVDDSEMMRPSDLGIDKTEVFIVLANPEPDETRFAILVNLSANGAMRLVDPRRPNVLFVVHFLEIQAWMC